MVKHYRREIKQYVIILSSLSRLAMHLEVAQNVQTDSFIQALRRFVARRENTRLIRCDNGINFVGANSELQQALSEMDEEKILHFLQNGGTDWVTWNNNPPSGSHLGRIWERQIKSTRVILLLKQYYGNLNDVSLITLMIEVESVVLFETFSSGNFD